MASSPIATASTCAGPTPFSFDAENPGMDPDLDAALEELEFAMERSSATVETQLHSLDEAIFEEDEGESTQLEPGPKVDRIAEMSEKLQGLEEEAEQDDARKHIVTAREHLQAYLKSHPRGEESSAE